MGIDPQHPTTQTGWNRRTIPKPQGIELLGQLRQRRHLYSVAAEQALDTSRGTGPPLLQRFQVAVQMALILGLHRVPKGLRHGYAIHAVNQGVPLPMLSKWMGHAIIETTAIYANAVGQEQQAIAARMWS